MASRDLRSKAIGLGVAVLLACGVEGVCAADGRVALQSADPSCPDGSSNIFVDCGNGTVTDNRTGLVWLANANCLNGTVDWTTAMNLVAGLSDKPATSAAAADDCGLSDGSSPGEWRLPSQWEWEAMIADALGQGADPDCTASPPTITNDSGLGCWVSGPSSFTGVVSDSYWSSTTFLDSDPEFLAWAWIGRLDIGFVNATEKVGHLYVWPVRGGQ